MNKKKLIMWLCILCCCATLSAQYGTLTSPIVGNDDSVTFRYYAPYAKSDIGERTVYGGRYSP